MSLTGLDQVEIQQELSPIIKELKINLDEVELHDIRKIVGLYLKATMEKRLKSVELDQVAGARTNYNHN